MPSDKNKHTTNADKELIVCDKHGDFRVLGSEKAKNLYAQLSRANAREEKWTEYARNYRQKFHLACATSTLFNACYVLQKVLFDDQGYLTLALGMGSIAVAAYTCYKSIHYINQAEDEIWQKLLIVQDLRGELDNLESSDQEIMNIRESLEPYTLAK